jgi:acetyl esterase/lipase
MSFGRGGRRTHGMAQCPPVAHSYGPTQIETLDIYRTRRPNAPISIFIHGGAWRGGFAKNFAYAAELFVHAGAHFVVPDFINVIEEIRKSFFDEWVSTPSA